MTTNNAHQAQESQGRAGDGRTFTMEAVGGAGNGYGSHTIQWHTRTRSALRKAEATLRMREEVLQRVIDSSPDCIKILDLDARIRWMSGPGRRAMAIEDTQDIVGTAWLDNWQGDDRTLAEQAVANALADGTGRFTGFCPTTKGAPRWWDVMVTAMVTADGRGRRLLSVSRDISDRKRAEAVLEESEARLKAIIQSALDCIVTVDHLGRITEFNPAAESVFGHGRGDMIGRNLAEALIAPAQRQPFRTSVERGLALGQVTLPGSRFETTAVRADGTEFHIEMTLSRMGEHWPPSFAGFLRDITARVAAETSARQHARQKDMIASFGQEALARRDIDELLAHAAAIVGEGLDADLCQVLHLAADGQSFRIKAGIGWRDGTIGRVLPAGDGDAHGQYVLRTRQPLIVDDLGDENWLAPSTMLHDHGVLSCVEVPIAGFSGTYGVLGAYSRKPAGFTQECLSFMLSIANIVETAIERKASDEHVAYLAQFDALTGLANRNLFRDRMGQTMTQAHRSNWLAGLMLVGLDHFKAVNDTYGPAVGDGLLNQVAQRLQACVRPGDTVARLSGDEFAIGWSDFHQVDEANAMGQKVRAALAHPFTVNGNEMVIAASIGVTIYPSDGHDVDTLLKNAEAALFRAKENGRDNHQFFTPELNARVTRRIALESELRQAIDRNEFLLHYQPQVCARTGDIVGAEALIRWQHPQRGLLLPSEFIAVAEASGLIVPIGQWVVATACAEAVRWQQAGQQGLTIAVNASPAELRKGGLPASVRMALDRSGLEPQLLEIELTENLAMDGADTYIASLQAIKEAGVSIAIDDFGTGYSSLSYLQRFPVDRVKVDRSFVTEIGKGRHDAPIVRAVIAMSHQLGLRVVAEGVETMLQSSFLHRHGCDTAQGYLFAIPRGAPDFRALVEAGCNYSPLLADPLAHA